MVNADGWQVAYYEGIEHRLHILRYDEQRSKICHVLAKPVVGKLTCGECKRMWGLREQLRLPLSTLGVLFEAFFKRKCWGHSCATKRANSLIWYLKAIWIHLRCKDEKHIQIAFDFRHDILKTFLQGHLSHESIHSWSAKNGRRVPAMSSEFFMLCPPTGWSSTM